ncbi:MAG: TOBE domain-containing protein, partial [Granulosicoccaceae bacterium]
ELGAFSGESDYSWPTGTEVDMLLRPDDIVPEEGEAELQAEVVHKAFKGAEIMYTLKLPSGSRLLSMFPSHHDHAIGERVGIRIAADHMVAFRRGE